jgi:RNA polymerase sigma factor (sigma-70 family)
MDHLHVPKLLDERGNPLSSRIEGVLRSLIPKFRKRFPAVRDELDLTEILEEAGNRIASREQRSGPLEKLHGYAWVTLRTVAASWMRRGSNRLRHRTVGAEESQALLSTLPAQSGSLEQIEHNILLREAMDHLSEDEWIVCNLKKMGFSGEQIAKQRGSSTAAAEMVFSRAKQKLRSLLTVPEAGSPGHEPIGERSSTTSKQPSPHTAATESPDGESAPATRSVRVHGRR